MKAFLRLLLLLTWVVAGTASDRASRADDDSASPRPEAQEEAEERPLSAAELKALRARGRLEKKIETLFRRSKFVTSGERAHIDDYFVVAKFQMPLETREAELRFEVMQGLESSTSAMADYLVSTPARQVRDFQVLSRFKSLEEAEQGLQFARNRYDQFLEFQAQMLKSMNQARSMRRC